MIDLYTLEQLVTFAQCGTLLATAERLHISQPALSQAMKRLERQMGVPLFERTKNRITLNETGRLAAELGAGLLREQEEMVERIRRFDKSRHTITLGACAPVPVADIVPLLSQLYAGITLSSEIVRTDEALLEGLARDAYQLVVLHAPPEREDLFVLAYREEHLSLAVPPDHPLSARRSLRLRDIDGLNLLLYTQIGFWYDLVREKLPHAHFLMMNEFDAFGEVAGTSAFPSFVTDAALSPEGPRSKKISIPIDDEDAHATYFCVCRSAQKKRFDPLFAALRAQFPKK